MIFLFIIFEQLFIYIYSWGFYGPPPPPPQHLQKNFIPFVPNNNLALGYPTAYGLGQGFVNKNGRGDGGPVDQATANTFPIRCSNGGAHIGNCRLDVDAICQALGGVCINSACCTVPFTDSINKEHSSSIIKKPLSMVDIEIINEKPKIKSKKKSLEIEEDDDDDEEYEDDESVEEKLNQIKTIDFEMKQKLMELKELYKLIDENKEKLMSPPSTSKPKVDITKTDTSLTSKTICESGMKPIGPCVDNSTCPINYTCEKNSICCFQI
uniref:WAP domain-containing protein n=1 Tax=Strongyloides papillosus TaxID=174720 RepID=A0A0N5BB28_STREA